MDARVASFKTHSPHVPWLLLVASRVNDFVRANLPGNRFALALTACLGLGACATESMRLILARAGRWYWAATWKPMLMISKAVHTEYPVTAVVLAATWTCGLLAAHARLLAVFGI